MRKFHRGVIASLALCLGLHLAVAKEDQPKAKDPVTQGYVLATRDDTTLRPQSGKIIRESEFKDGKLKVQRGARSEEGVLTNKRSRIVSMELLGPGKYRLIEEKNQSESKTVIGGREQPEKVKPSPLLAVPVILEKKDGKWAATLEADQATPEQATALTELAERTRDFDFELYGGGPRRPGDKWEVDPKHLDGFEDTEDLKGSCTMQFVEIKDHAGVPCAVLRRVFDVSGVQASANGRGIKVTYKGQTLTYRSLADHLDLESKTEATITLSTTANDGATIQTSGLKVITETRTLKKP